MMELPDIPVGAPSEDATMAARSFEPADWSSLADEQMLRQQMRERFAEAVDELPAIYRTPVILRDVKGLSTEEASRILKLKDQTLKSRLHRGRLMLRKRLEAFADGVSLHRPAEVY
jgi:RNA polymerase sigma-70 factor (ECF subfamily)